MTDRQDPAQDGLIELTDEVRRHGATVTTAEQGPQHFEQFMANSAMGQTSIEYTGSIDPRHEAEILYRDEMSEADTGMWLATFDHEGRWRNPETGAWESLRSEVYDEATGEWRPAYTGTEYAPGGSLESEYPVLKITVMRVDRQTINPPVTVSESADLSTHSDEPGIGYGVFFHVTHGLLPQEHALSESLEWNLQSARLRAYDRRTGHGYFHLFREPAPEVGGVIDLTPGHRAIMGETRDAGKLFCGYTCSAEPGHKEAMNARRAEAEADNDKWRSTFDENGRYLDPVTGFWESLNAEFYVADTQEWVLAYDDDEAGPVSGTRDLQRATLPAAQIRITKVDDEPLLEFRALPRDNAFPGHAEVVNQRPPPINAEQAARIAPKTRAERWVSNFVLGLASLAIAMLASGMWLDLALFEFAGLDHPHQIRDGCILLVIALALNFATGRVAERNDKPA